MFRWIDSTGQVVKTRTIKEFSEKYSMNYRSARALASGYRSKIKGWCSTSRKAKRTRLRFTTRLVNSKTGQLEIVGQSARAFAERHDICYNDLVKLLNGHKIMVRGWAMERTLELAHGYC